MLQRLSDFVRPMTEVLHKFRPAHPLNQWLPHPRPRGVGPRVAQVVRLPRRWWRMYSDWRGVLTLLFIGAFVVMVLIPSGVALSVRGKAHGPSVQAWLNAQDEKTTIRVYQIQTGTVIAMPLGEYLTDVLAAQLPPDAPQASLRAAAIAARTYAVRMILLNPNGQASAGQSEGQPASSTPGQSTEAGRAGAAAHGQTAAQTPGQATGKSAASAASGQASGKSAASAQAAVASSTKPSFAMQHGADVTDTSALDLPLQTQASQESLWGDRADANRSAYQQAILATDGEILTYQGKPILAFTFAMSPGQTRSAKTVFNRTDIPYLKSVACPDDQAAVQPATTTFTAAEVAKALGVKDSAGKSGGGTSASSGSGSSGSTSATGGASGSGSSSASGTNSNAPSSAFLSALRITQRDAQGFVQFVAGPDGRAWNGQNVANALGLASGNFRFHVNGDKLVVETTGVGQDIGLSLHEATAMGERGVNMEEILATYYPGTKLEDDGLGR